MRTMIKRLALTAILVFLAIEALSLAQAQSWSGSESAAAMAPGAAFASRVELDSTGVISGYVFAPNGSTPISGATVSAQDYVTTQGRGSSQTGADGRYSLGGLDSGYYRLQARATGYVTQFYEDGQLYSEARPISVAAPDATTVNFVMETAGSISGTVRNSAGSAPLSGTWVIAFKDGSSVFAQQACVNASGGYRIYGLKPGNYRVAARGYAPCGGDQTYQWEFYQEELYASAADLVPVTAGANTPNIDFTLAQAPASVSGQVSYSGLITGAHPIYIEAPYARRAPVTPFEAVITNTGPYTLSNIPYASYFVDAFMDVNGNGDWDVGEPKGFRSSSGLVPDSVRVTQTAVAGIDIALDDVPRGPILGWLEFQGRTTPPPVQLSVGPLSTTVDLVDPLFPTLAKPLYAWVISGTYTVNAKAAGYLSVQQAGVAVGPLGHVLYQTRLLGGDADNDDDVDIADLVLLGAAFGTASAAADINGDGSVSIFDIAMAGANFGRHGPLPWW